MIKLQVLNKVLFNSWVISFVLGFAVFILIPFHPDPYKIDMELEMIVGSDHRVNFADLDGDGEEEIIKTYCNVENKRIGFVVTRMPGHVNDQYNINGADLNINNADQLVSTGPLIGDYNNDGSSEIFGCFQRGNTVWVKIFCPYDLNSSLHGKELLIYAVPQLDNTPVDIEIITHALIDFNKDGKKELLVSIHGRYKYAKHRRFALVDLEKAEVTLSENFGSTMSQYHFFDFEKDGKMEFTGAIGSSANITPDSDLKYPDNSAWLMVFNSELELLKSPIEFPGLFTTVSCRSVDRGGQKALIGLMKHGGDQGHGAYLFETRDLETVFSKVIIDQNAINNEVTLDMLITESDTTFCAWSTTGSLFFYDDHLKLIRSVSLDSQLSRSVIVDANSDGKDDMLFFEKFSRKLMVVNSKGRLMAGSQLDRSDVSIGQAGVIAKNGKRISYFQKGEKVFFFTLIKNYLYHLSWAVLIGLIAAFYLLANGFKWIQRRQTKDKLKLAHQLSALQLQTFKNQLDPHFTFNALNVLNFLSAENDTKGIQSFTHHFSKLMRRQLEISDKPSVNLYDELRFVRHYIELQKLRFDVPIFFDEEIDQNVNMNLQIPKMMIHTHVENAIKHGLIPAQGGTIQIRIRVQGKQTEIEIEDNGVGRNKTNWNGDSTGKGHAILIQLYDLFYQLYKVKIHQEILDLQDKSGKPSGTLIRIRI